MIVSTRGRYALRVLIDIAEHSSEDRIPLKEIAERQDISQKYIEAIMTMLSKSGLVDAVHGKGGGYKLNRAPSEYKIGELWLLLPAWKKMPSLAAGSHSAEHCQCGLNLMNLLKTTWTVLLLQI